MHDHATPEHCDFFTGDVNQTINALWNLGFHDNVESMGQVGILAAMSSCYEAPTSVINNAQKSQACQENERMLIEELDRKQNIAREIKSKDTAIIKGTKGTLAVVKAKGSTNLSARASRLIASCHRSIKRIEGLIEGSLDKNRT